MSEQKRPQIGLKNKIFDSWTKKYPLSKTLRFELKPLPQTRPFLDRFVQSDTRRDQDYRELKKIVDEYHKEYIAKSLSKSSILLVEDIKKTDKLWREEKKLQEDGKRKKIQQEIKSLQGKMRKQVKKSFKDSKELFGKELLSVRLPNWLESANPKNKQRKKEIIKKFKNFSTYLKGFHKNRENIYSDKEQSTAIAHRIVNENLLKFLSNRAIYERYERYERTADFSGLRERLNRIKDNFKEEFSCFGIKDTADLFRPEFFNKCLSQKGIDGYNTLIGGKTLEGGQKIQGLNETINQYRQENQMTRDRLSDFQPLYKQILSDREKVSFLPEAFENREDLAKAVDEFWKKISNRRDGESKKTDLLNEIKTLFTEISEEQNDLNKIYFERGRLSDLSQHLFRDWRFIQSALEHYVENGRQTDFPDKQADSDSVVENKNCKARKKPSKSVRDKEKKQFLEKDFFSFQEIQAALQSYRKILDDNDIKNKIKTEENNLLHYFQSVFSGEVSNDDLPFLKNHGKKSERGGKPENGSLKKPDRSTSTGEKSEGDEILEYLKTSVEQKKLPQIKLLKKFYDLRIPKILKIDSENSLHQPVLSASVSSDDIHSVRHSFEEGRKVARDLEHSNKTGIFSEEETESLKVVLDSLQNFLQVVRPVRLEKNRKAIEMDKDTSFYNRFDELYSALFPVIDLYNKCRNFISENKNHLKKIKINFENSYLLAGWDVNKEQDNLSVLLRKKESGRWSYYLGVMDKQHKNMFDYHLNFEDHGNTKTAEKKEKLKKELLYRPDTSFPVSAAGHQPSALIASGKPSSRARGNPDERNRESSNKTGEVQEHEDTKYYEKMNYKLLPGPDKMLPKVFFSKKKLSYFSPDRNILRIRENKTYAKNDGEQFSLQDCHKLIDFYKQSINKHYDWKKFGFKFSPTDQYKDMSDFYHEVSRQGYKLSFDKIRADYIEEKVRAGYLYLFKIYNKDFSRHSKGKLNLHTTYFKMLFDEENLEDVVFKMNGEAEIFHRKASLERTVTHKKNRPIANKNPLNPKKTSQFTYDIYKDRRFTEDKFFFHLPMDLNFKAKSLKDVSFNRKVLSFLKDNKNINIIGIDRGERHLAYWTVINQSGAVLEQGSFNCIKTEYKNKKGDAVPVETDYHKLLDKKEKERDRARKSWTAVKNIKNLKAGYLSHIVHEISRLMIKHNAVVIFEDLNAGFKRGRMKFEKQVYQKLEKALIDKLNYLVFKDRSAGEPGGCLNAYQLTAKIDSFQKMSKQTGFVFYTSAYYTSKVCPLTGFVDLIHPRYKNIQKSKEFFKSFESIYFDGKADYFVFEYKDDKVNPKRKSESQNLWKVCSHGSERYKYDRNKKESVSVNVTEELKGLFEKYEIKYLEEENLMESVCRQDKKDFWLQFISLFHLTLQLRHINSGAETDEERDYILSPVADSNGRFFDSRKARSDEPQNADGNGAYHIALKGVMMLSKINSLRGEGVPDLKIKNKDWFDFVKRNNKPKVQKAG